MKKLVTLALIATALTGCSTSTRIGDFTVASTKNMDVKDSTHQVDTTKRLVGIDEKAGFLFVPPGLPDIKEAMDNAIEQNPEAVGMSNVTLKFNTFDIPFLYRTISYEVEGSPVFEKQDTKAPN
ncbi:hypothetical protein L9G16_16740 [Shewanella sp. A25]|nr:hypothetical protein [Shewanella shenzhenensis]